MSKPAPWELDPTYLEQTGLDPQQVWERATAAAKSSTSQSTSPPPSDASPPPSASSSSPPSADSSPPSSSHRPAADSTARQQSSPPPTSTSAPTVDSSTKRPEPWKLDPTYLEQTGLDPQYVRREIEMAVRQSATSRNTSTTTPNNNAAVKAGSASPPPRPGSSPPGNNAVQNAGGSSTRRPEPWKLDPTYLEQAGLDPEQVRREIDAAVRQAAPKTQTTSISSSTTSSQPSSSDSPTASPGRAPSSGGSNLGNLGLPDFSKHLGVLTLGSILKDLSDSSTSGRPEPPPQPPSLKPRVPVDYLIDQRDPVNVANRLSIAFNVLQNKLKETASNYRDVLSYDPNNNKIDINPQLQNRIGRYRQALSMLRMELPSLEGMLMTELGDNVFVWDADAGPPDLVLPPDQLKRTKNAKVFVTRQGGEVNIELVPDFEKTAQDVSELFAELNSANEDYWNAVQSVVDEFNKSSGGRFKLEINDGGEVVIDEAVHKQGFDKVVNLNREYGARLQGLIQKYGAVVSEDGRRILVDPSKLDAFRADLSALDAWYGNELDKILKEHGLTVKDGKIVVDMSIYSDVFSKLSEIGQEHNKRLQDIRSRFGYLLVATTDEKGRTVYMLKPSAISDAVLYNTFVDVVNAHGAAVRQTIQNIADKYGDVLSYDPKTGKIAPSKELEDMLGRYDRAMREVNQIIGAMSAVAGMLQTTAQRLPTLNIEFMTYDADKKSFVLGSETPIYIEDPEKRKELLDWLKMQGVDERGRPNVGVAAFVDPRYNLPVAYIYNKKTGEGYFINYMANQVQYLPDAKQYAESHMQSIWFSSLSPKEWDQYVQSQQLEHFKQVSKREFEKLPPGIREIVGTLVTAGRYVFVPDMLILKGALFGDKDPLFRAKKFHAMVEGIGEVSPITTHAGTALGIGTIVGGAAAGILARGAAKLAVQGAKTAAGDAAKFAAVKKPRLTTVGTTQPLQQTVKSPTLLQTAAVGLKDAAVPMAVSGTAFGGLEGVRSYLETGSVDVSRVLEGAAFGSLLGAFPITRKQALAALGIGAGATAGVSLVRGYDLATSLAVGEAAGLTAVVGGGLKGLSEAGVKADAKTPGVRASDVKITDFAIVIEPKKRLQTVSAEHLADVARAKPLSNLIDGIVKDVITGRLSVEDANSQLGIIRDTIWDKKLFDDLLRSSTEKWLKFSKTPTMEFATAANKAAEVIYKTGSEKLPKHKAFIELADLRASVVDKAGFDKLFGKKLKEYGEHYIQWLLSSGRDKSLLVLDLHRYEDVLGRQLIKKYMPDYAKALADVKYRLSQLRPVNPRKASTLKLTPEMLTDMIEATFRDVLTGKKDFFKASEKLYWLWNKLTPDMRPEFEAILRNLNAYYGKKYGITLEPWRPSLLESILRRAELSAAGVRSVLANASKATAELIRSGVKTAEEFLSPAHLASWWKGRRMIEIESRFFDLLDGFRSGKISLEETRRGVSKLINKIEKMFGRETAEMYRKHFELTVLDKEFRDVVRKFKRGEISLEEAKKRLMEIADNIEKIHGKKKADFYREYAEEVLTGKRTESMHTEEEPRLSNKSTSEMNRDTMPVEMNGNAMNGNRLGEIGRKDTERRSMQTMNGSEKSNGKLGGRRWAGMYDKKYVEEVLSGKHREPRRDAEERGAEGRRQQLLMLLEKEEPVETRVRLDTVRPIRADAVVETVQRRRLTPKIRSVLVEGLEPGQKLREIGVITDPTTAFAKLKRRPVPLYTVSAREVELQKRRRRVVPPKPRVLWAEESLINYVEPRTTLPRVPEINLKHPPLLATTATPNPLTVTAPTYATFTVPKIRRTPTYRVPTASTYSTTPPPRRPPPRRLPSGWWHLLPPRIFADRTGGGAYKVQGGKRQILALA